MHFGELPRTEFIRRIEMRACVVCLWFEDVKSIEHMKGMRMFLEDVSSLVSDYKRKCYRQFFDTESIKFTDKVSLPEAKIRNILTVFGHGRRHGFNAFAKIEKQNRTFKS